MLVWSQSTSSWSVEAPLRNAPQSYQKKKNTDHLKFVVSGHLRGGLLRSAGHLKTGWKFLLLFEFLITRGAVTTHTHLIRYHTNIRSTCCLIEVTIYLVCPYVNFVSRTIVVQGMLLNQTIVLTNGRQYFWVKSKPRCDWQHCWPIRICKVLPCYNSQRFYAVFITNRPQSCHPGFE